MYNNKFARLIQFEYSIWMISGTRFLKLPNARVLIFKSYCLSVQEQ